MNTLSLRLITPYHFMTLLIAKLFTQLCLPPGINNPLMNNMSESIGNAVNLQCQNAMLNSLYNNIDPKSYPRLGSAFQGMGSLNNRTSQNNSELSFLNNISQPFMPPRQTCPSYISPQVQFSLFQRMANMWPSSGIPQQSMYSSSPGMSNMCSASGMQQQSMYSSSPGMSNMCSASGMQQQSMYSPSQGMSNMCPPSGMPQQSMYSPSRAMANMCPPSGMPQQSMYSSSPGMSNMCSASGMQQQSMYSPSQGMSNMCPLSVMPQQSMYSSSQGMSNMCSPSGISQPSMYSRLQGMANMCPPSGMPQQSMYSPSRAMANMCPPSGMPQQSMYSPSQGMANMCSSSGIPQANIINSMSQSCPYMNQSSQAYPLEAPANALEAMNNSSYFNNTRGEQYSSCSSNCPLNTSYNTPSQNKVTNSMIMSPNCSHYNSPNSVTEPCRCNCLKCLNQRLEQPCGDLDNINMREYHDSSSSISSDDFYRRRQRTRPGFFQRVKNRFTVKRKHPGYVDLSSFEDDSYYRKKRQNKVRYENYR